MVVKPIALTALAALVIDEMGSDRRWQEAFPDARTHVVEDAGHWVLEDAHEQALPWIREFLQISE